MLPRVLQHLVYDFLSPELRGYVTFCSMTGSVITLYVSSSSHIPDYDILPFFQE